MPFSVQNLVAVVAISFVAIASSYPCAAGQQAARGNVGRMSGVSSFNPLRTPPSAVVHAGGVGSQVEWAEQLLDEPAADPVTRSLSLRVAAQPTGNHERSLFRHDRSPAVVVWLNSDLQNALVSERQLKQWMHSGLGQEDLKRTTRINTWQLHTESPVRSASFVAPEAGAPVLARSDQEIQKFKERLEEIRKRYKTKKQQLDEESKEGDDSQDELNSLSKQAFDWIGRATSGLETLETKTKEEKEFEDNLKKQEASLAKEKEKLEAKIKKEKLEAKNKAEKELEDNLKKQKADPAKEKNSKPELLPSGRGESLEQLQEALKEQQAILQDSIDSRSKIREQLSARDQRVAELPGLLRERVKEDNETKKLIDELKAKAEESLSRSLEILLLDARLLSLEISEKSLELDNRRQEQMGRILPLKLEEVTLRIKRLDDELANLSKRSDKLRDQEIKERLKAARDILEANKSTPRLKTLAKYNADLVNDKKDLATESDQLKNELINVRQLQEELDQSHEQIKSQIETLGPTASGIRLVEHRRSLISTGKSQNRLLELAEQMQLNQTKKLLVKERRDQLVLGDDFKLDVLAAVEKQVEEDLGKQVLSPELATKQREMAVNVADQLLETQKKYTTDLVDVFEKHISRLTELDRAHRDLIDKVQEVKAFSDKNALWVRSAEPIELGDLKLCQAGLRSVLVSDQWGRLAKHASENFQKHTYHAGLLALVIGSLLVVRRRLRWSHE